jgi:hypothetical protein
MDMEECKVMIRFRQLLLHLILLFYKMRMAFISLILDSSNPPDSSSVMVNGTQAYCINKHNDKLTILSSDRG